MLSSPRHSFGPIGKSNPNRVNVWANVHVHSPPTHPGRSSRETLSPYPMMLASISCYLFYDSIGRAHWHPVKISCSGSFMHQICFGRWGGSLLRTIPFELVFFFFSFFWEIKHYGNEFSASYWPVLNAFFSSLYNLLLLLLYWSSSPRLVILMHISLEIIHTKSPWTCRQDIQYSYA